MEFLSPTELNWILVNCWQSLFRVSVGILLAFIIGTLSGALRSLLPRSIKQNAILNLLTELPKFPPPIAWIPFVILLSGIGDISAILIVFIGAVSPIFTASFDGAESLIKILRNTAASLEIKRFRYFSKILYPATLPYIFTGLRSGVSMGWMSVIAAELVSGQSGLGYSIQLHRLNLQYELMSVDMILIGLIGFLLSKLVQIIEQKLIPWHERAQND